MDAYGVFAQFYDRLTQNVDYQAGSRIISGFFSQLAPEAETVLDLACGTGNMTANLAEAGYRVTGMDLSEDMLGVAASKNINGAVFVKGDMTSFTLPERVDCCVCALDSLNHLDGMAVVKRCFECVYNALNDSGVFIFDVNTVYKHRHVLENNTFVFDEEDFFLSWDNELTEHNTVRILLDFFIFNGVSYDRCSEEFTETAYETEELKRALSSCFEIVQIIDADTLEAERPDSERLYFVCKRK